MVFIRKKRVDDPLEYLNLAPEERTPLSLSTISRFARDIDPSKLFLAQDAVFKVAMQDNIEMAQEIISALFEGKDYVVTSVRVQKMLPGGPYGMDSFLDALVEAKGEKFFDLEMQLLPIESLDRAAYYFTQINNSLIQKGEGYGKGRKIFVIFFCRFSPFKGRNEMLTRVSPKTDAPIEAVDMGFEFLFVDMSKKDPSIPLGRINHDLNDTNPDEMYSKVLADGLRLVQKDNDKRRNVFMTFEQWQKENFDKGFDKGFNKGFDKGEKNKVEQSVLSSLKKGIPAETIAEVLSITVDEVHAIARKQGI